MDHGRWYLTTTTVVFTLSLLFAVHTLARLSLSLDLFLSFFLNVLLFSSRLFLPHMKTRERSRVQPNPLGRVKPIPGNILLAPSPVLIRSVRSFLCCPRSGSSSR
jgi:hypothetical protein